MHGGAWSLAGGVGSRLSMLLLSMLLIQVIGTRDFSRYAMVQSTIIAALVVAGYGPGLAATKFIAQLRATDSARLGRLLGVLRAASLLSSTLVGVGIAAGAGAIASYALGDPAAESLIRVAALAVFFAGIDGYQSGALVGFEAMRSSALALLFAVLLGAPMTLVLGNSYGDIGAVGGLVTTYALQCLGSWWWLRREFRRRALVVSARGGKSELRGLLAFIWPAVLSALMVAPTHWIVQAALMRSFADGMQLAVFTIAMQWFYAICFIPQFAGRIILPVLSEARASGNVAKSAKILKSAVIAYGITMIPVALVVAVTSGSIISLYGAQLPKDGGTLGVVALAAAVASIGMPVGQAIAAEGRMWLGFAANLLWAVVFGGGAMLLMQDGAYGVGVALLVAYLVLFIALSGILRTAFRGASMQVPGS